MKALAWALLAWALLAIAPSAVMAKPKVPVVKWGQKSDKLYLTIPLPEVQDPEVEMEDKRIFFKGVSKGQEYEVNLKLLRPINVTGSKHTINDWSIHFDLKKDKKEPCWLRLLKTKQTFPWLKKDHDHWYYQDCQHQKELWREAYFTAKNRGEDPSLKNREPEPEPKDEKGKKEFKKRDPTRPPQEDPERKKAREDWEKQLNSFRDRAVPRSYKEAKGKAKAKKQQEGKRKNRKKATHSEL